MTAPLVTRWVGQPELTLYCDTARPQSGSALQMAQNGLNWTYYNGYATNYSHDSATGLVDSMTWSFQHIQTSPRTASVGKTFDEVINMDVQDDSGRMNFLQLQRQIQKLQAEGRTSEARGKEVDLYGKLALPLASLIRDRFLTLLAQGGGSLDWSAISQIAAHDAGLKP